MSLRIGRQKLVYGTQRMVSPLEWVNTARVFDGARIGVGGPGRKLDAFATRLVPVTPTRMNDHAPTGSRMFNSQLHGVYYTDTALVAGATVEGYWLLRRAARLDDGVHTIGTRVDTRHGPWAFDGELAGQTGSYGGLDHRAALLHVGASYTTGLPGRLKLGTAFNVGSGDDDPADGIHGTFDQLYPLGHAYYGYMDLFALQNLRNTEVTVEAALPRRTMLRVALQDFALLSPGADAWYNVGGAVVHHAGDASISSHVGNELDITVRLPVGPVGRRSTPRPRLRTDPLPAAVPPVLPGGAAALHGGGPGRPDVTGAWTRRSGSRKRVRSLNDGRGRTRRGGSRMEDGTIRCSTPLRRRRSA